jgi:hypothetical protein
MHGESDRQRGIRIKTQKDKTRISSTILSVLLRLMSMSYNTLF